MENKPPYTITPSLPVDPLVATLPDNAKARAVKLLLRALSEGRPFILIVEGGEARAFYLDKAGRTMV